ncbi:MAG: glycerol acyltransferase [Geobacteraceae bacterium GWC2_58_44]|nr:MAG: glycerol acyltransferase [Geobacteraceae bacterium GWC2_58_44]HBG06846.1 glycerol acyltransferase [Geobacter sp.]
MSDYYPPWGFYYRVEFDISKNKDDVRFQSLSGLSVEYDMEEYREGGENRFIHKLPVRTKYSDLVLKRGMMKGSELIQWFLRAFRDREFQPTGVTVILMNEKSEALHTWKVAHAIPRKWTVSDLNANENAVVIETLELSYRYFTMQE